MFASASNPGLALVAAIMIVGPAAAAGPANGIDPQIQISPKLQERMKSPLQLRQICWTEIRWEKTENGIGPVAYKHCTLARH